MSYNSRYSAPEDIDPGRKDLVRGYHAGVAGSGILDQVAGEVDEISQNQNQQAQTLAQHREILNDIEDNTDKVHDGLDEGNRSLRNMFKRAVTNKIIIFSIIGLLVVAILVLLILGIINQVKKSQK
ncbi:uncharacterized protein MONOS_18606 [Monocercomonoides exilis]|uniref:uncharacterized protein n=1 Tax=Monocercomonoides exilis TaxID=2049356 RepID=UPI00355A9601|nr:hypothetical protein MONOS_18606 [Monocercomonoides exilis]